MSPRDAVAAAFEAAGGELEANRDVHYVRARHALVTQHAEIQERELIKLAALAAAVKKALRARGVPEPAASLVAEAGIAAFAIGFERWLGEKKPRDLAAHPRGRRGAEGGRVACTTDWPITAMSALPEPELSPPLRLSASRHAPAPSRSLFCRRSSLVRFVLEDGA